MLGSLIEVVNVTILFKIHFTRMVRSLCHGVFCGVCGILSIMGVECSIIFVGNHLDEIVMQSAII